MQPCITNMYAYAVNLPAMLAFYCCARKERKNITDDFTLQKIVVLQNLQSNLALWDVLFCNYAVQNVLALVHFLPGQLSGEITLALAKLNLNLRIGLSLSFCLLCWKLFISMNYWHCGDSVCYFMLQNKAKFKNKIKKDC